MPRLWQISWLTALRNVADLPKRSTPRAKINCHRNSFAELGSCPREQRPRTVRRLVSDQTSSRLRRTIDPTGRRPTMAWIPGQLSCGPASKPKRVYASSHKDHTVRGLAEHVCDELAVAQRAGLMTPG